MIVSFFSSSSSRATQDFDLVHFDLYASAVFSLVEYKYYLVILDDFSHFLWTFPLRLKSSTFTTFLHFFVWVSTQFERSIYALQCDNGQEFDNSSCSFFLSHGVQLWLSCTYTSPQNDQSKNHDLHHHHHAPLPPLLSVSSRHILGRGAKHCHLSSQQPPL